MKRKLLLYVSVLVIAVIFSGCAKNGPSPTVQCSTGIYVGTNDAGISVFRGIHYAKNPTGKLRWKAPVPVDKSSETIDATHFGKTPLQLPSESEQASQNPEGMGEDCLTLNIWTKDPTEKDKPVMFWIHGGAYSYGGTADPLYDGKFILQEHPDIVLVTANYRLGPLGFADFSGIEGGEDYPTAGYNGILDQIEALKWVRDNIEAFGGDPGNVTIFGESAGGGSVTQLLVVKEAEGLFQHAIAQSGSLNFTMTHERFAEIGAADTILYNACADNMKELAEITEDEFSYIYLNSFDGKNIASLPVLPLRGEDSIIPEDPYKAILDGAGKDVDLIIGTTADENRYFADAAFDPSVINVNGEDRDLLETVKLDIFDKAYINRNIKGIRKTATKEENKYIDAFLKLHEGDGALWSKVAFANEYGFRGPAMLVAYNHARAGGKGKTYMYYFCKKNTNVDWMGACHASELSYVFHNLEDEQFSGRVIPELADQMCGAWTSFAADGDPEYNNVVWPEYSPDKRETMFFNDDGTVSVESDPLSAERLLTEVLLKYYRAL